MRLVHCHIYHFSTTCGTLTLSFHFLGGGAVGKGDSDKEGEGEVQKKHTETLNDLEQQYELSRFMTHMAKGAGLGYGSSCLTSERKVDATNTDEM